MKRASAIALVGAAVLAGCGASSSRPAGKLSADLARWRAARDAALAGCIHRVGGADKAAWVTANLRILDSIPVFPGAGALSEYDQAGLDNNQCPEGMGPATSYTTWRTYRLPARATPAAVLEYYTGRLGRAWHLRSFTSCDRAFRRAAAGLVVSACYGTLSIHADYRAYRPLRLPQPPVPPPPDGHQYPLVDATSPAGDPNGYEAGPGRTCERAAVTIHGPKPSHTTMTIPPPPGLRARLLDGRRIVFEWSIDRSLPADCTPASILLSFDSRADTRYTPTTFERRLRGSSGSFMYPYPAFLPEPDVARASLYSVDGARSRTAQVLVRQR